MGKTSHSLFLEGEDRTGAALKSAKRNFSDFESSMVRFGKTMAGVLGAAGIGTMLKNVVDAADEIGKLQETIGGSTEFLSQMRGVFDRANISFQTGTTALQRLQRRAADAAKGTGPAAEALKQLGINAEAFAKLNLEDKFDVLAEVMDRVDDSGKRVALMQKLVDTEGVALLRTMEGGAEATRAMREEMDDLGLTIGPEAAEKAAKLNDAMANLKDTFRGIATTIGEATIPAIDTFFRAAKDVLGEIGLIEQEGDEDFVRTWSDGLKILGEELDEVNEKLDKTGEKLELTTEGVSLEDLFNPPPSSGAPTPEGDGGAIDDAIARREQAEQEREERARLRLVENLQEKARIIDESFQSELEREQEAFENRLFIVEEAFNQEAISFQKRNELIENLEQKHQQTLNKIEEKGRTRAEKFSAMSWDRQVKTVASHLIEITQGVAQHNRVLFEINRVAAIAQATIRAYQGAAETLGAYPWPLAQVLAAIHLAAGLAQVAAIAGTSFQGGGGGAAPSLATGGTPVTPVTAEGETITAQTEQAQAEEPTAPVIEVTFTGIADAESIRQLIDQLNEEHENGYRLRIA